MSNDFERKFTEEECVANGGHFWRYWRANTPVNKKTFEPDYSCGRYATYWPNGEPEYRGCPLCGRKEEHIIIDKWEEI